MAMNSTTTSAQTIDSHVPAPVADKFDGESIKENEAVLKFINDMLMDDNLELEQYSLHPALLQATEKSLHDALVDHSEPGGVKNKNRYREADDDYSTTDDQHISRSNKQPALDDPDEAGPLEKYDDLVLFPDSSAQRRRSSRKAKTKKLQSTNEQQRAVVVDLSILLMQCAQAIERFNIKAATDLLYRIRKHSSPLGTAPERVAHYFANALEARLSGTGKALREFRTPCRGVLRALRLCITSCPFMTMSSLFTKSTITNILADDDVAATLHVIDFGIMYGFQWPCLIQALSERPGGPPKLRITGIDHPLLGFRPAERVVHTGDQIAKYCERFEVPFEYNGIAMAWDKIRIEDLKLREGEVVIVHSLYRMHGLSEINEVDSARDAVLKLIRQVEPRVFVHGVVNGAYKNAPFFVPRFKEALTHYGAIFDMLEATVPQEEEGQMTRGGFEDYVLGRGVMNVVACEGADIVESPETYKQWGRRSRRIGFRQMPVEGEIMRRINKVKSSYHKEFSVSEDEEWVLFQWKGRAMFAFSSWQPHNAY